MRIIVLIARYNSSALIVKNWDDKRKPKINKRMIWKTRSILCNYIPEISRLFQVLLWGQKKWIMGYTIYVC